MSSTYFTPQLFIKNGTKNIDFYNRAFDAVEIRRWSNDDGSIHVVELTIDGAMFHLHEESAHKNLFSPENLNGSTVNIGLFVADVDQYMKRAIDAGATEISAAQDYDYGYRQGSITDPFGHYWTFQKLI